MLQSSTDTIYDFTSTNDHDNWYIINDGVMGGLSKGSLSIDEDGNGVFTGRVRLENNGGFTSLRYGRIDSQDKKIKAFQFRIKGDGKSYQFRAAKSGERFSYVNTFQTSGEWEIITIDVNEMEPSFRGRKLDYPKYDGLDPREITFLIGNKRDESFELKIDYIKAVYE